MLHTDPVLCSDQRRIDAEVDLYNQVSYPRVPFLRSFPEEATRFTVIASFLAIKNWRLGTRLLRLRVPTHTVR